MINKLVILFSLYFLLSGCNKNLPITGSDSIQKTKGKLSDYFGHLKIEPVPTIILGAKGSAYQSLLDNRKSLDLVHIRDSVWSNGTGKTSFYESDKMVVTPGNASYIYPGSILQASSIATDQFATFSEYQNAPISVDLSFPSSLSIGIIHTPSLSNSRIFLRNALMAPDFRGDNIINYSDYLAAFSKYNEVKLAFGYNVNERKLFSSTNSSFEYNSNSEYFATKFMASYTVENFTFNMSDPVAGELIDVSTIPANVFSGVSPVYINSVTYGRFGLLILESNNYNFQMKTVFEKVVKKILKKSTESYTQEEKSLFANCRITIYLLGSTMGNNIIQLLINPNPEGISDFISQNVGTFTPSDPGVPIFYTAKYLKDNSKFKTMFKIDY
ncbi:thiol-activated cytolysin family protein [Sphingobacterium thalpophilum]|uniref:thiol-activated cytolysin family protein n=1 Tax=Sphingobacterium thalpophilum TaxID=259 RepID=UPI003C74BB9D